MTEYDGDIKLGVTLDPKDVKQSAEELGKSLENAVEGFTGKKTDVKTKSLLSQISQLVAKSQELQSTMSTLENTNVPTEEYKNLNKELQKAEGIAQRAAEKFNDAYAKMTSSNEYKKLSADLSNYESKIDSAIAARDELLEKGYDVKNPAVSRLNLEIDQLMEKFAQTETEFENLAVKFKTADLNVVKEEAIERVEKLKDQINDLRVSGKDSLPGSDSAAYEKAKNNLADVNNKMRIMQTRLEDVGSSSNKAQKQANKLLVVFKNLGGVASGALNKLKKSLSSVLRSMIGLTKQAPKMSQLFDVKKLLMYGLGIRGLFTLVQKLKSAIKEGLSNMAKWNGGMNDTNRSLSALQSSLNYLKNAWGAAFAPILSFVAPVLSRLIDMLATAANYIGAFFAALTGKNSFVKAKKVMTDYANGVGAATSAVKDQAKAEEELENQLKEKLGSYDKLEVIQDDTVKDNKNSGGGGADPFAGMFEDVAIDETLPKKILDWIERLKEAWTNEEWRKVGNIIAEGLNAGMLVVDNWINTTLRPFGTKWAAIFAEIGNGIVEAFDWTLLGKTVADGFNAIVDIVLSFTRNFDWYALGAGIGIAIASWFATIEWDNMGKFFSKKWRILIEIVSGIVDNTDWESIGSGISTFITSWFDNIPWSTLATTISNGFNGVIAALQTVIAQVKWQEMSATIGSNISNLVTGINWTGLGMTLSTGFNTVILSLGTFIQSIDWSGIAQSLFAGIAAFIININWAAIGQTLSSAVMAVLSTLSGLFADPQTWVDIGLSLGAGFVDLITNIDWIGLLGTLAELLIGLVASAFGLLFGALGGIAEEFATYLDEVGVFGIVEGLFEGIISALAGIGKWLKENVVDPIVNGVKSLFGISSPSTVFAEIGGFLIDGLLGGISKGWELITGFFSSALGGLTSLLGSAWDTISGAAATAWDMVSGIGSTIAGKFTEAKDKVVEIAGTVKEKLGTAWTNIKTTAGTTWTNIKTTVGNKFTNLKTSLSTTADNIKTKVSSAWDKVKSTAETKWSSLKTTVTGKFENLKSSLSNTASTFTSIGSNLVSGIQSGISSAWSGITNTVSSLASSLTGTLNRVFKISSPSKVWAESGKFLDLGLLQGLESEEDSVLQKVKSIAGEMTDSLSEGVLKVPDIVTGNVTPATPAFVEGHPARGQRTEEMNKDSTEHPPIILQLNGKQIAEAVWNEEDKKYKQYNGYVPRFA